MPYNNKNGRNTRKDFKIMEETTIIMPKWFEIYISLWIITYCLNYITSTDLYKYFKKELLRRNNNERNKTK